MPAVQRFQHLRGALQLKHGVERGAGRLRSERSFLQIEARQKKRACQNLQSGVDKAVSRGFPKFGDPARRGASFLVYQVVIISVVMV